MNLPAAGHCLCGNITYQLTEAPLNMGFCHCHSCQRETGCGALPFMFMNETAMEDFEKSMEELGEGIEEFNAEFGTDEEEIQEEPKEESEIANVLEGYKVIEVNFKMTDFESGETIGECFIKKYNDINCKAYREYENPFFGMQMCDFSEE